MFLAQQPLESLYLHWPFCPYKCHFCPFVALASHDAYMEQYHHALLNEIDIFTKNHPCSQPIKTIFLGGGTPSTYPLHLLSETFDKIHNCFSFTVNPEITIEINPGTIKPDSLITWKKVGINRLSIGVQSLKDDVLKKLNRHQTAQDVITLLDSASTVFNNVSVDLILGLPGVSADDWRELLETIVTWPIKHMSLYFLTIHEDTPLYFGVKTNKISLPPDDEIVDLYRWSIDHLATHGFQQYEISNFAKPGFESRHNSAYWQRVPYKGFGLGACSFDGIHRSQNEKNLMRYCAILEKRDSVQVFYETLTKEQIWLETLMLGLRQRQGISLTTITQSLAEKDCNKLYEKVQELCAMGLLIKHNDHVLLSIDGLAVENEVVLKLSQI